jgi:hypothetical protein
LTVYQLPADAPQLNPVEGICSLIRRNLANTAFADPEHLIAAVRHELRAIQYRPHLITGRLTGTGLALSCDGGDVATALPSTLAWLTTSDGTAS